MFKEIKKPKLKIEFFNLIRQILFRLILKEDDCSHWFKYPYLIRWWWQPKPKEEEIIISSSFFPSLNEDEVEPFSFVNEGDIVSSAKKEQLNSIKKFKPKLWESLRMLKDEL